MFNWVLYMSLKLKIKTPEQHQSLYSGASIVDFEHI